jgi:hypothetical protein
MLPSWDTMRRLSSEAHSPTAGCVSLFIPLPSPVDGTLDFDGPADALAERLLLGLRATADLHGVELFDFQLNATPGAPVRAAPHAVGGVQAHSHHPELDLRAFSAALVASWKRLFAEFVLPVPAPG